MDAVAPRSFSIGEVLKRGYSLFKERWGFWISLTLLQWVVPAIPNFLTGAVPEDAVYTQILLAIIHFVLQLLVSIGFIYVVIKATRNEQVSFSDFFARMHRFPSYLLATILAGLAILFSSLLLIIPGIIVAMILFYTGYIAVDQDVSGYDALGKSSDLTKGSRWDLFAFALVALIINLLGSLVFLVGLLVTYPITALASAAIYNKLLGSKS